MSQYTHKLKSSGISSICYRAVFLRIILMKTIYCLRKLYICLNSHFIIQSVLKKNLLNIKFIRNRKCNLQINARFLYSFLKWGI